TTSLALLAAATLLGLGYGSLLPGFQTLSDQSTTTDRSGHAMSTFFIFYDLGIASGAFIWSMIMWACGFLAMYLVGVVLVLATAYGLYSLLNKQENKQKEQSEVM